MYWREVYSGSFSMQNLAIIWFYLYIMLQGYMLKKKFYRYDSPPNLSKNVPGLRIYPDCLRFQFQNMINNYLWLNVFVVIIVIFKSCSCLSPLASVENPDAQSVEKLIGPRWEMLLFSRNMMAFKLSAFSDLISIAELNVEKLSVIKRTNCFLV